MENCKERNSSLFLLQIHEGILASPDYLTQSANESTFLLTERKLAKTLRRQKTHARSSITIGRIIISFHRYLSILVTYLREYRTVMCTETRAAVSSSTKHGLANF